MSKKQDILDAYEFRYACKEFDPEKKISDEDFEFILKTGRLSPSSFGWEPWKFVVVQNMELREKLKAFSWGAQRQLPTASHFVLMLARKSDMLPGSDYLNYIATEIQQLPENIIEMKGGFYQKFQEQDFDLTDERKLFDWASKQVYIPLGNMMTAAAQIGIDSCPIEGFDAKEVNRILEEEGIMNSEEFGLAVMVAFGYRAKDTRVPAKTRQPMDRVVQWVK